MSAREDRPSGRRDAPPPRATTPADPSPTDGAAASPRGDDRAARIAAAARAACRLEVAAEKPGNVTPTRSFADLTAADLRAAGDAAALELGRAGERRVGATVLAAVRAARAVSTSNANLGIVLLLAPPARAAARGAAGADGSRGREPTSAGDGDRERGTPDAVRGERPNREPLVGDRDDLRAWVRRELGALDHADAVEAFAAIREARAGGMGDVPEHDVADAPDPAIGLGAAMAAATDRDRIAAEYASGFAVTFEVGLPVLDAALDAGLEPLDAVVELHLELLAALPDTLIARKLGPRAAADASRRAAAALAAGPRGSIARTRATGALDAHLRADGHRRNPGTTADLVAATLFVAHLDGTLTG